MDTRTFFNLRILAKMEYELKLLELGLLELQNSSVKNDMNEALILKQIAEIQIQKINMKTFARPIEPSN